jgi:hypothetical protein
MKLKYLHIILGLIILFQFKGYSQDLGYYVKNDSIHFVFDVRDYDWFTSNYNNESLNSEQISIESVSVAGEFNKWALEKWNLKKIDDFRYELSKDLNDFNYEKLTAFKYVINGEYWAEPEDNFKNTVQAYDKYGFFLHTKNLQIYSAFPSAEGNVFFNLKGYPNAEQVVVSGSFNNWNEQVFKMQKTDLGWGIKLKVNPGEYQYKFIVDGNWITDPNNPHKVNNEFGGYNSVITVKTAVNFTLKGYEDADEVILSGSFNSWNEHKLKMTKTDTAWVTSINLTGGKHHYKFIVDGEWIVDPENSVKEYDYSGNINSVKMVH